MGTDIHPYAEVRRHGVWHLNHADVFTTAAGHRTWRPFGDRDYAMFGLFAGVRDHNVTPIAKPRGIPADVSTELRDHMPDLVPPADPRDWNGYHTASWLTLGELQAADYDQQIEGWFTGTHALRKELGDWYFSEIAALTSLGGPDDVRIVFWFDS